MNRYQKGKTNLDFTEARVSEWQWHQVGHMQVGILLLTDNHATNPPLSFLQAGCPSCRPTNSVEAHLYLLANFDKHANRTCIATIRACHSVYKRETDMTEFTDLWMLPACYWTRERHGHSAPHWLQLDSLCSAAHRPTRTHADTGSRLYLTSARSRGRDLSMLYLADTQRHNYTRFTHGQLSINHTTVTETYNW